MTIIELAEAVGETPRQIRYLIAEGLIAGPEGSRARPDYGAVHVEAIRRYQALRQEGMKPSQVKALLQAERLRQNGGQFILAPGAVLSIDLNWLDPKTSPRAIGDLAAAVLTHLLQQAHKDTRMPPSLTLVGQDPLGQFRHLAQVRGTERPIPLTATRFSVRILGTLALVTAERRFRNAEQQSIEATITFPVPVHAALVGLSAQIGGRRLLAQTQRKAQAREHYEAAINSGQTAVLHEEALRGIHMISAGHVPPGQTVAVQGLWVMPLAASGMPWCCPSPPRLVTSTAAAPCPTAMT